MKRLPEHQIQTILAKHTDPARDVSMYMLRDGRQVIDQIVDSENHLHYVVRNPDQTTEVIDGQNAGVAHFLEKRSSHTVQINATAVPQPSPKKETKG